jgi:hypothetical protein
MKKMTYADLKAACDKLSPEQLAQPVVWSGDERGGHVLHVWISDEDWIGEPNDPDTWMPRSRVGRDAIDADDYKDASVCLPAGTVHLMVD